VDEKTKKVLLKVAKEVGVELLRMLGSKISQVASELQRDEWQKVVEKERNPSHRPFGSERYSEYYSPKKLGYYDFKENTEKAEKAKKDE
jgi:hypothetical protein